MQRYVPKKAGNLFTAVQGYLYKALKENKKLSCDLQIFHQIPKDTSYPYIYIGRFSVINRSTKENTRMIFVNEIHIYSQNHSTEEILNWSNEIKKALRKRNVVLPTCHVVETDFLQMALDIMPDSKVYRAVSKYRIIVEERYGRIQRKLSAA